MFCKLCNRQTLQKILWMFNLVKWTVTNPDKHLKAQVSLSQTHTHAHMLMHTRAHTPARPSEGQPTAISTFDSVPFPHHINGLMYSTVGGQMDGDWEQIRGQTASPKWLSVFIQMKINYLRVLELTCPLLIFSLTGYRGLLSHVNVNFN